MTICGDFPEGITMVTVSLLEVGLELKHLLIHSCFLVTIPGK